MNMRGWGAELLSNFWNWHDCGFPSKFQHSFDPWYLLVERVAPLTIASNMEVNCKTLYLGALLFYRNIINSLPHRKNEFSNAVPHEHSSKCIYILWTHIQGSYYLLKTVNTSSSSKRQISVICQYTWSIKYAESIVSKTYNMPPFF